jgi:phosphate transport system permease protein
MSVDVDSVGTPQHARRDGRGRKPPAVSDAPYRIFLWVTAFVMAAVIIGFFVSIFKSAYPGWQLVGFGLLYHTGWNFANNDFGALPLILGTLATTSIALVLAIPVSIAAAFGLAFLIPRRIRPMVSAIVELLAVIPSVIYGLWGFFVLRLALENHLQPFFNTAIGYFYRALAHVLSVLCVTIGRQHSWAGTFQRLAANRWPVDGPEIGSGLLLGGLVLAIMILPIITAISRDVFSAVPGDLIEGGFSLGATRSQVLRKVVLPSARRGVIGAIVLGTGRALGETIAMVFLLGDAGSLMPSNLNAPTATLASEIANNFGNFSGPTLFGVLCCLAVILMVLIFAVNSAGRWIVARQMGMLQS